MSGHQPLVHNREFFGISFSKFQKVDDNSLKIFINESSFMKRTSIYGTVPSSYKTCPFISGERIYICQHVRNTSVYEESVFIVSGVDKKNYSKGDAFSNPYIDEVGTVYKTVFQSTEVYVEFNNVPTVTGNLSITIERALSMLNDKHLFQRTGIPDGSYEYTISANENDTVLILQIPWKETGLASYSGIIEQTGFGRVLQPDESIVSWTESLCGEQSVP